MKRKNLCIVSVEGVNQRQSIPRMTDEFVSRLNKLRKYNISVVTKEISKDSKIYKQIKIKHILFAALHTNLLLRQINNLTVMRRMRRIHSKNNFDITHTMDFIHDPYADVVTVQSTIMGGIRTINFAEKNRTYAKMLRYLVPSNWISYVIERRTSKRCKKIIAISKKISKELIEFYNISPSKITLIYPATNLQKFRPLNEKEKSRLRKKLEFKDEQFIIVFIGYHFLRKGGDLLLDAIRMLRYRYPQIQTIFIGSEKRTEKNCTFLTDVSDVETYYGIADAFVFPTKYEPFGYVTLEAMACGLPVIVSPPQYNGAAEIINNKQNGILLKDLTAHEVAKEIETLIKNPHIRKKIGREARKVALHYNWAYFVKNTQTVYSETK